MSIKTQYNAMLKRYGKHIEALQDEQEAIAGWEKQRAAIQYLIDHPAPERKLSDFMPTIEPEEAPLVVVPKKKRKRTAVKSIYK